MAFFKLIYGFKSVIIKITGVNKMANKKYTLYFKGENKYGHNFELPIVSLNLKELDMYTSNYIDYVDLFNNLPIIVKSFIKNELGIGIDFSNNDDLERCFFVTDFDYTPIMNVIFEDDIDVLYVEPKEITNLMCKIKMKESEFRGTFLNTSTSMLDKFKYEFFKYLYVTYVKNHELLKMIDTYDVRRDFKNLDYDNIFIAAIATSKDNIMVVSKKLSQTMESRRNLALVFKKLFKTLKADGKLIDYNSMIQRKNKSLDLETIFNKILLNFEDFKKEYDKEYE